MNISVPSKYLPNHLRAIEQKDMGKALEVPETWDSVYSFGQWWCDNGMPILLPTGYEVYLSDDATSVCLFRKGRFQVELYLIHPGPNLPIHEHPGVDVIKMRLNTYDENLQLVEKEIGSTTLLRNQSHGAGINFKDRNDTSVASQGFPLLAFQKWDEELEMTTVASRWKGKMVGPLQAGIVKRFNPNAFIEDDFIDVTRST